MTIHRNIVVGYISPPSPEYDRVSRAQIIGMNYNPVVKGFRVEDLPKAVRMDWLQQGTGNCKIDHGERTNHKLRDQPFHARGRTGKMRKW